MALSSSINKLNKKTMFFSRSSGFVFRDDSSEIKIISPDRNNVFYLNDFASFLFLSLNKPRTIPELTKLALARYDVDKEVLEKDIKNWLKESIKSGFIQKSSKKNNPIIDFLKEIKRRVS